MHPAPGPNRVLSFYIRRSACGIASNSGSRAWPPTSRPTPGDFCFGGRKLFNAQHHLAENGFVDHEEWLAAWRAARSCQFLVVGSTKESFGNQSCQLVMDAAGKGFLNLRLTNRMEADSGKSHLKIPVQVACRGPGHRLALRARGEPLVRHRHARSATGRSCHLSIRRLCRPRLER